MIPLLPFHINFKGLMDLMRHDFIEDLKPKTEVKPNTDTLFHSRWSCGLIDMNIAAYCKSLR